MKRIYSAVLLFVLTSGLMNLWGQEDIFFEHISVSQGLSNPTLFNIIQDHEGFMWFASADGLNRYDGYEFRVYKNDPQDPSSLPGNLTWGLTEDTQNRLWVGGNDFLALYDRVHDAFKEVNLDRGSLLNIPIIKKIFEDSKGRLWIGANRLGIQLLDPDSLKTRQINVIDKETRQILGPLEKFVEAIIETHNGVIYAGSANLGLLRFDEELRAFEKVEIAGYKTPNNMVDILEDEFGKIWIAGFQNGLQIYDPSSGALSQIPLKTGDGKKVVNNGVLELMQDSNGYIWIGTFDASLFRYNPVNGKYTHFPNDYQNPSGFHDNLAGSIYQDIFGNIWIGTDNEGLNKTDPNQQQIKIIRLPQSLKTNSALDYIQSIFYDENKSQLLIGTAGAGLFRYDMKTKKFTLLKHDPNNKNSLSSNRILSINMDSSNEIWVGTDSSLNRIDAQGGKIRRYFSEDRYLNREYSIGQIVCDPAGRIYLATSHGVDIFFPLQNRIKRAQTVANRKLSTSLVAQVESYVAGNKPIVDILKVGEEANLSKSFSLDKKTQILIVGAGEGRISIGMFDYGWLENEEGNILWSMQDPLKTFHLGGGLKNRLQFGSLELPPGKYKLRFVSDVGHSYGNWNVAVPADSMLWGIQALNIDAALGQKFENAYQNELKSQPYMPLEQAYSICLSKQMDNIIWIGSAGEGLIRYNLQNHFFKQYKIDINDPIGGTRNDVTYVYEDDNGFVWFASQNGLGKLDPETDIVSFYGEADGLPTNYIQGVIEDSYGNLWISSLGGLSKMVANNNSDRPTFINLDIRDGLQGFSYSNAVWKSRDGVLFFGGTNGLNAFQPGRSNRIPPKIVFTDFRISEQSILNNSADSPFSEGLNGTSAIILPFERNDLSMQFSPLHFSRPGRNKIIYKLDGFNKNWIESKLHFASFTNLNPGEYIFRLKAANSDGLWSKEEKSLKITILAPWYRTWFAYGGYVLMFFAILFGFRKFELNRKMKNARIKESELKAKAAEMQAKAAEAQNRAIQAESERKSIELEEARELQLSMLPKVIPQNNDFDIAVYMKTATEVGGDYYDFSMHENGSLNVAIGDATGHGMKAGTLVASIKSLFIANSGVLEMDQFFVSTNTAIKRMQLERVMMGFAMLQIHEKHIHFINAGMPPLYHYREKSKDVIEIKVNGMPLGAMDRSDFSIEKIDISRGDCLLMLSDGMPELKNNNDEMFGYERLASHFKQVAEKSAEEIIAYLKNAGSDWVNNTDPEDDVTFVVIKVK